MIDLYQRVVESRLTEVKRVSGALHLGDYFFENAERYMFNAGFEYIEDERNHAAGFRHLYEPAIAKLDGNHILVGRTRLHAGITEGIDSVFLASIDSDCIRPIPEMERISPQDSSIVLLMQNGIISGSYLLFMGGRKYHAGEIWKPSGANFKFRPHPKNPHDAFLETEAFFEGEKNDTFRLLPRMITIACDVYTNPKIPFMADTRHLFQN